MSEILNLAVYPLCTSLRRIRCFYRFSRLVKSITYTFSIPRLQSSNCFVINGLQKAYGEKAEDAKTGDDTDGVRL